MAGIYIHIPFCKQACHYCNFHFATSLTQKKELINTLALEIEQRKSYTGNEPIETIYFGGGTPSILLREELELILYTIGKNFSIAPEAEITLEANPDDLTAEILSSWKEIGINRLSIGVQSFFEEDLLWMHRAHDAQQAKEGIILALQYFENITVDLIYGTPGLSNEKWKQNVEQLISLDIPHISCYALTIEPKTPLAKMIRDQRASDVDPDKQSEQFLLLMQWLEEAGYEHYEISNYAKPGFRSRHNSSYWGSAPGRGKKYLGVGPSAHSFNGGERQWNISNNAAYVRAIGEGGTYFEKEILSKEQELNEYIMTALRTTEGIQLDKLDAATAANIERSASRYINSGLVIKSNRALVLTKEGKLLADGIAAALFT